MNSSKPLHGAQQAVSRVSPQAEEDVARSSSSRAGRADPLPADRAPRPSRGRPPPPPPVTIPGVIVFQCNVTYFGRAPPRGAAGSARLRETLERRPYLEEKENVSHF